MNIFKTNTFISESYTNEHLDLLLKSLSINENIQGLKYILCKIQDGYDFSNMFDTIIKLVDTTNFNLKKLTNEYLRYFFIQNKDEDRKLLIVNTVLKDFTDMSDLTVDYIVDFSTSTLIYTYMPQILKYIENNGKKASYLACQCDTIFGTDLAHKINTNWSSYDYLNLASFTNLEIPESVLVSNIYNTENLIPIVRKISYDLVNTDIIGLLYKKDSIPLFYYAFKIINNKHPKLLQDAYDTSLIHMSATYENMYHILILHESILDKVSYSNETYIIYYNEPNYVKKQKIRILFKNLDEISIREIRRYNFLEIIELSVLKNCNIFEDVFYENETEQVIKVLYKVCKEGLLKYFLQKYLISLIEKAEFMKEITLKMFLHLCSIYFDSDNLPVITANFNSILSYYLNLYKRDVLDKKSVLKSLQKYNNHHREKVSVISGLIKRDINSITQFTDTIQIKYPMEIKIDLYSNLLDCKPYLENSPDRHSLKKSQFDVLPDLKNKIKTLNVKDSLLIKEFTLWNDVSKNDRIFIDHKFIKGVVFIKSGILVLEIDVLESDITIECVIKNQSKHFTLSKESKLNLCEAEDNVQLKLYEEVYNITILNRISKNIVSKKVWEREYNKLTKYKLVDYIDFKDVYKVDNEKFSFKVFSEQIFGRIYNNQIILKGPEQILKDF